MVLNKYQQAWLAKNSVLILWVAFIALLITKFLLPLFWYGVPLGYDAGFYRYLFIRHAEGFPPFVLAPMDEWARGHPLGLFFFTTILLKLGMPVSWLLGWIWNLFPVVLASVFAWIIGKRESGISHQSSGKMTGVLVLLAALLSIAYFDGFAAMYWKTFASLLWCIVTYRLLERKSPWAILTGILTVATHHQTGLLFGLVFATWVVCTFIKDVRRNPRAALRSALPPVLCGLIVLIIGVISYLPVWKDAVLEHVPAFLNLLKGNDVAGGSFPPALFYLQTQGILLALGAIGFGLSFKRERFTLWQLSAFWSFVFVAGHLLFYRRFFLQLDFFLLPFAAIAIHTFWTRFPRVLHRLLLVIILLVQAVSTIMIMQTRVPDIDPTDLQTVTAFADSLPADAFVLGLDNQTATLLRGWLPFTHVGGPGLFESHWSYEEWSAFLLGSHDDRVKLLSALEGPVYVYISPYFTQYYGESIRGFLTDSCFALTEYSRLYSVTCKQ